MIQKQTKLTVIDNSGGIKARCIHVYKGYRARYAKIGDRVLVSLLSVRKSEKADKSKVDLKKGALCKGVVVRTKASKTYKSSKKIIFKENSIALVTPKNKFYGTRIFGVVPDSIRGTKYLRLCTMATGTISNKI